MEASEPEAFCFIAVWYSGVRSLARVVKFLRWSFLLRRATSCSRARSSCRRCREAVRHLDSPALAVAASAPWHRDV